MIINYLVLSDLELERLAASDRDAFGVAYERHFDRVYDFVFRILRDRDEAADVTQETFIRALKALSPERAGQASLTTWLFTIARNLSLNKIDSRKRTRSLSPTTSDGEDAGFDVADESTGADPNQVAETHELSALVWEAAAGLDERQYSVLDLHVRQGLDSAELAGVLGVSKGNAYTILSRTKDAFESAFSGLLMLRRGRRECSELDRVLGDAGASTMTPDTRRIIDRHSKACTRCSQQRTQLVRATALFGMLTVIVVPLALRRNIAEAAWKDIARGIGGPGGGGAGSGGSGKGGNSNSSDGSFRPRRRILAGVGVALLAAIASTSAVAICSSVEGGGPNPGGTKTVVASASPSKSSEPNGAAAQTLTPTPSHTPTPTVEGNSPTPTMTPAEEPTIAPPPSTATTTSSAPTSFGEPPVGGGTRESGCDTFWAHQPKTGAGLLDDEFASTLLAIQNSERAAAGLSPLIRSWQLDAVAAPYAQFVAEERWWKMGDGVHTGLDKSEPVDRMRAEGVITDDSGQIVALGRGPVGFIAENEAHTYVEGEGIPKSACELHKDWTQRHIDNYTGEPIYKGERLSFSTVYVGIACYADFGTQTVACIEDFIMFP